MKRIQIMVYTLYVLASVFALLPSASDSFLDVISYEDEGTKRSLAGNNCLSTVCIIFITRCLTNHCVLISPLTMRNLFTKYMISTTQADVKCELAGTKGVECAGNLKIRKSDCRNGQTYPQPVVITWRYCNTDTANQDVNQPKTKATFKRKVKNDTLTTLVRGECRVITRTPSINVCKRGATMSLKYEGRILSRSPSYCYAYKFLRVNTEYLPERPCAVTVSKPDFVSYSCICWYYNIHILYSVPTSCSASHRQKSNAELMTMAKTRVRPVLVTLLTMNLARMEIAGI